MVKRHSKCCCDRIRLELPFNYSCSLRHLTHNAHNITFSLCPIPWLPLSRRYSHSPSLPSLVLYSPPPGLSKSKISPMTKIYKNYKLLHRV